MPAFNLSLLQDAILVYQDIDLARSPVVNPRRFRALFKSVGFNESGDDIPTLYNFYRKPYRQLIAANQISYFDFRSYFFARQQLMLIKLGSGMNSKKSCQIIFQF